MDPRGVKVVVRYADGRFTKGKTYDFQVGRPRFHVFADPRISDALPVRVTSVCGSPRSLGISPARTPTAASSRRIGPWGPVPHSGSR